MTATENKGKTQSFDKGDMNGLKPFGMIGKDRDADRSGGIDHTSNIVSKLNKNHKKKISGHVADGSTIQSGEEANALTSVVKGFANRRKLPL